VEDEGIASEKAADKNSSVSGVRGRQKSIGHTKGDNRPVARAS
jgi:hypothetical protein